MWLVEWWSTSKAKNARARKDHGKLDAFIAPLALWRSKSCVSNTRRAQSDRAACRSNYRARAPHVARASGREARKHRPPCVLIREKRQSAQSPAEQGGASGEADADTTYDLAQVLASSEIGPPGGQGAATATGAGSWMYTDLKLMGGTVFESFASQFGEEAVARAEMRVLECEETWQLDVSYSIMNLAGTFQCVEEGPAGVTRMC